MPIITRIPSFWDTVLLANKERSVFWGGDKINLGFKFIEMVGEFGEWANTIKKLEREKLGIPGSRTSRDAMLMELGDFLITVALVCNELNIKAHEIDTAVATAFNAKSLEHDFPVHINAAGLVVLQEQE